MSARILQFPKRAPFDVVVTREGAAWLVIVRDHGWLHSSHQSAIEDARWLARNFRVSIKDITT
jgi:hypothetical protein